MTIMIPDKLRRINNEITNGEKRVYGILHKHLSDESIAFYNLRVEGYYPDFVVVHPFIGLVVLEVKDWSLDNIESSDANNFIFRNGNTKENPVNQALCYMRDIENILCKESRLLQDAVQYKDKLKFTRGHGVVFPNISRGEFISSIHRKSIESEFIIFSDDLNRIENCFDRTYLEELLNKMFTTKFYFSPLRLDEMNLIKMVLNKESAQYEAAAAKDETPEPTPNYSSPPPEQPKVQAEPQYITPPPAEKKEPERSSENPINSTPAGTAYRPPQPPVQNNTSQIEVKPAIAKKKLSTKLIIAVLVVVVLITTCYKFEIPVGEFFGSVKNKVTDSIVAFSKTVVEDTKPFMVFKVIESYSYIGIGDKRDHPIYLGKNFKKDSFVEFYNNKRIVVTYPDGKKKEIIAGCDPLYIEIGNHRTTVYYKGQEIPQPKSPLYFRYSFATDEILMGWKDKK